MAIAHCTLTATPELAKKIQNDLDLEIEMMQGSMVDMGDGRVEYTFEVTDPDKQDMINEFCLKLISLSHKVNLN